MSHTPGPWYANWSAVQATVNGQGVVVAQALGLIEGHGNPFDNAKLMAMAPILLRELQHLVAECDALGVGISNDTRQVVRDAGGIA